jgi:hypothetical protein
MEKQKKKWSEKQIKKIENKLGKNFVKKLHIFIFTRFFVNIRFIVLFSVNDSRGFFVKKRRNIEEQNTTHSFL